MTEESISEDSPDRRRAAPRPAGVRSVGDRASVDDPSDRSLIAGWALATALGAGASPPTKLPLSAAGLSAAQPGADPAFGEPPV